MSKLRIALIDDDLERAQFIQESLLLHDFQVVACLILNDLNMVHVKGIHAGCDSAEYGSSTSGYY